MPLDRTGVRKETIYAVASGGGLAGGRSAVAVIRISGPATEWMVETVCPPVPKPRQAVLRAIRVPETGEILDQGLVLWFPAPRSFTGEGVLELQVHGSPAVVADILKMLAQCPGCRLAEPGEFTRRAFDSGKMDLTAVEGLGDLIAADTSVQRREALRQLQGVLGRTYDQWRGRVKKCLAVAEASIDFVEEELPEDIQAENQAEVLDITKEIELHLRESRGGERLREGLQVVLLGAPNAGKSSLLNALARRDVAIVHESAGTTRDVIEVKLDLNGYPVLVADTAGLRKTMSAVEKEGIRRSEERAEQADVRLLLVDGCAWEEGWGAVKGWRDEKALVVVTKIDRCGEGNWREGKEPVEVQVSNRTGVGLNALIEILMEKARMVFTRRESGLITRERYRQGLEKCANHLRAALELDSIELFCEELRGAMFELGRLTGRVGVEEVLDVIFQDFCIGK